MAIGQLEVAPPGVSFKHLVDDLPPSPRKKLQWEIDLSGGITAFNSVMTRAMVVLYASHRGEHSADLGMPPDIGRKIYHPLSIEQSPKEHVCSIFPVIEPVIGGRLHTAVRKIVEKDGPLNLTDLRVVYKAVTDRIGMHKSSSDLSLPLSKEERNRRLMEPMELDAMLAAELIVGGHMQRMELHAAQSGRPVDLDRFRVDRTKRATNGTPRRARG